jgi:hypothetical protein
MRTIPSRVPEPFDDVTVYLVLIDHGKNGIAHDETDPPRPILRPPSRLWPAGTRTLSGWRSTLQRDGPETFQDIAQELLQRAINAADDLGEGAQRFVDRQVIQPPARPGTVELPDHLKANFEKRPPAPSIRRGPTIDIRQRPRG